MGVLSQEFNYVHYDIRDGLAGSTVYDMCQDKDGFIWFATENGLSRFDGTHFKNFTVKDGLPDNEVLKVFADSKGRVWIGTFCKDLCFYFKGTIFNKENSSLVKKVHLKEFILSFGENEARTLMICDGRSITNISSDDRVTVLDSSYLFGKSPSLNLSIYFSGIIYIHLAQPVPYYYNADTPFKLIPIKIKQRIKEEDEKKYFASRVDSSMNYIKKLRLKTDLFRMEYVNGYSMFSNSSDGSWSIDTAINTYKDHFLPGKKTSRTMMDLEGHLWFSTLGEGVFKLPSREIRTINYYGDQDKKNTEVFSLSRFDSGIVVGRGYSKAIIIKDVYSKKIELNFEQQATGSGFTVPNNRLYCSKEFSSGALLLGFDAFLIKKEKGRLMFNYTKPIKSIAEIDGHTALVGTKDFTFKINLDDLKITDTVWRGRATTVYCQLGKYYIGTINGLYQVNEDKSYTYLGAIDPLFTRRITAITSGYDNTLWVATSDQGILGYKDGKVKVFINDNTGLSSNICKTLFLQKNFLWVGTNKGLNKIDLSKINYPILKYSSSSGLPSDIINTVYVKDSIV